MSQTVFRRATRSWLVSICLLATIACDTSKARQTDAPRTVPSVLDVQPLPNQTLRGVCLAHNWQWGGMRGYGTESSAEALAHLDSVGVNSISATPFGYMPSLEATHVRGEHSGDGIFAGETKARLVRLAEQTKERGMSLVLKPHIWVEGGLWRGHIKPISDGALDWASWWTSYTNFIVYYARLAEEVGAAVFVVGVELASAIEHDPKPMLAMIARVREVYSGHLTYAANWNEPVPDSIWEALDSVGVQFYAPLSKEKTDPPLTELRDGVRTNIKPWVEVANRVKRPLSLTEVGFRSARSAVRYPSAWPEKTNDYWSTPNPELQEKAYQALFLELANVQELHSVYVWKYFTDKDTDEEGPDGFSPRNKLAEHVLKKAYQ